MASLSMLLEPLRRNIFQLQQETLLVTVNDPENYEDQHGAYGYGVRKKEGESIHEFFAAMNMTVGNTF